MAGVLDHGFVVPKDFMGGDLSVVNSAKVSFQKGSSAIGESEGRLINYLMRHRHGSPFEHSVFTLHVKCPIFVAREWMRHRIGCLTGDTVITCVSPSGKTTYKRTIKEIYDLKYGGVVDDLSDTWIRNGKNRTGGQARTRHKYKVKNRTRILPNCQDRTLRVLNEATGEFTIGLMKDIWETGTKSVSKLHLEGGRTLTASLDHMVLTKDGWKKQGQIMRGDLVATDGLVASQERPIPPSLRAGIGVWTTMMRGRLLRDQECYICGQFFERDDLVLDHVIPVAADLKKALDEDNLKPACVDCHRLKTNKEQKLRQSKTRLGIRWAKVTFTELFSDEVTYDIEMVGPHHNYVANGIIVHNSFNEVSGRYVEFQPEFYIPEHWRVPAPNNKQGSVAPEVVLEGWDEAVTQTYQVMTEAAYTNYKYLLELGIAKEMARMVLPLSLYTEFYWTVNARSLMNFLSLRTGKDAQWEIQQFAAAVEGCFETMMPVTYDAWIANERTAP